MHVAGLCIVMLCLFVSSVAFAFDSDAWMQKRTDLTNEIVRLRAEYAKCVVDVLEPAEDVVLPIETFPDGSVRLSVRAQKAQYFLNRGLVWAEGVDVRKFKKGGEPEMTLEAENCVIDRETKSGWAEGAAKLAQGGCVFRGKGIYFSSPENYVRVTKDSNLESTDFKSGGVFKNIETSIRDGVMPRLENQMVRIRSRSSDFDRKAGVILFEGGVCIEYGNDYTLCADRVFAFLSASNRISRVVATGGVSITNELRVGTCAMATYRRKRGEIDMFGERGGAKARLVENGNRASELQGDRIRFWIDSEQVQVENSAIRAEHGGEGMKKEDLL